MRLPVRPRILVMMMAPLALAACGGNVPDTAPPARHDLARIVVQAVAVPTERVVDGTVEAVNHATVTAQTGGRVTAILHDVNETVPAGAVLLRIQGTEQRAGVLAAQAALTEAQARHDEAVANHQRLSGLYPQRLVSRSDLDQATADRDAAAARLTAAEAQLTAANEGVAYTEIRAPYAGVVGTRLVETGEVVSTGTPLMTVLSLRNLRVHTSVPQSVMPQVRRLNKAAVYIADRRIEVSRITLFPEAATPSSTFRAWLHLPPGVADLAPGMHVKVGLVTGEQAQLAVPQSAVIERSEIAGVYVIDPEDRVSLRYVRLGRRTGADVQILAGLAAGEVIATDPVAAAAAATTDARP